MLITSELLTFVYTITIIFSIFRRFFTLELFFSTKKFATTGLERIQSKHTQFTGIIINDVVEKLTRFNLASCFAGYVHLIYSLIL